jgi:hypothetical protein
VRRSEKVLWGQVDETDEIDETSCIPAAQEVDRVIYAAAASDDDR